MTDDEVREVLRDCPVLFHMAAAGAWPSIARHGLLSTSALLDLYGYEGEARRAIEAEPRPRAVVLRHAGLPPAVVRDQIPLSDAGLRRCLPPHLAPADWCRLLNARVFFSLTWGRIERLLGAASYRDAAHDVIEVEAEPLVRAYRDRITLSPINSGATSVFPVPRDETTFRTVADYPYAHWRKRRPRGERVVELAVDRAVPDIARFTRRVIRVRAGGPGAVLFQAEGFGSRAGGAIG